MISPSISAVSAGDMPCVGSSSMQELGVERHAQRDLDPALVAVREIADELVRLFRKPELLEELAGARERRGQPIEADEIAAAPLQALAGEPDVLEHAQAEEQVGDLERARDAEPRQP